MTMSLDRRELLVGLLGLPLAALGGCQQHAPQLPPAGEILGAAHELGHRLRGPLKLQLADEQYQPVAVAIVGGGVAGLAAARRLQQAGIEDFVILELEDVAGGTSRAGQSGPFRHPWGAHYLPAPMRENAALVQLLDEMDVVEGYSDAGEPQFAEAALCRDPEERLFVQGAWHEGLFPSAVASAADQQQFQAFHQEVEHWVAFRDAQGRRAFTLPVAQCSDDAAVTALDQISFAQWLDERGITAPALRWWLEYATRDDYGLTLAHTSAWAGLFYFAARVREVATEPQPLLTWPEGNGRLVAHLQKHVANKLRVGHAVAKISASDDEAKLLAIDRSGKPTGYRAKQVIFAAPHFLAPYTIADFPAERHTDTRQFTYGAWLVANLTLRARPGNVGFEPAWDNVLYASPSLGYVSATHQQLRDHGPTVWTYYYPLTDDNPAASRERLLELSWAQWADFILTDLEQAHPDLRGLVERLDIMHWGHAMIQPRVGFMFGGARQREAAPWHTVHFAHSDLSGVALFEEAFDRGTRAAEAVLATIAKSS